MLIPSKEEISKMLKNNVLLKIKEFKDERDNRNNQILELTKEFTTNRNQLFIDVIVQNLEHSTININVSNTTYLKLDIDNSLSKTFFKVSMYEDEKIEFVSQIEKPLFYSSDNEVELHSYILSGKLSEMILQDKFKEVYEETKKYKKELNKDIDAVNVDEIINVLELLEKRLEELKFEEAFKEGNTFVFDYPENIKYKRGSGGRRYSWNDPNSVRAKILHIVRITPTMAEFKVKESEDAKDWFTYSKEHTKSKKLSDGEVEKEKYTKPTQLIKKKKEYVYSFITSDKMKLIKTQSRALKIKNLLESEEE